ncbi:MAG: hypothetical protein H0W72_17910 [Planctomycetes bacterium]|nr:hypothetical protein [Planctomycetota bacterium]
MPDEPPIIALIGVPQDEVESIEALLDERADPPLLVVADDLADGRSLIADLAAGRGEPPQLVVIGARIPTEARAELLARLRRDQRLVAVQVLVLGTADRDGRLRAHPGVTVLPRPTSYAAFEALGAAVRDALASAT